jgi:GTP pyrophosphokinase
MLAQVAGNISAAEADIDNIIVNEQSDQLCIVNLTLSVQGRVHLAKVLRRLRSIKAIKKIIRPR